MESCLTIFFFFILSFLLIVTIYLNCFLLQKLQTLDKVEKKINENKHDEGEKKGNPKNS